MRQEFYFNNTYFFNVINGRGDAAHPGRAGDEPGRRRGFVLSIRGLADVTTTINGRNIFTSSGRSVALADIPATLVNRVDVYKTRSPEQISRGLAGQIDVHTNRPFDFDSFKALGQIRAIYQEQADEIDPNVSLLVSNVWDTGAGDAVFQPHVSGERERPA